MVERTQWIVLLVIILIIDMIARLRPVFQLKNLVRLLTELVKGYGILPLSSGERVV